MPKIFVKMMYSLQGGGVLRKLFDRGAAPDRIPFDRIPFAKEIWVENIPLAEENFLLMSPFLHDFEEFPPKYSFSKIYIPKRDANLATNFLEFSSKI